MEEKLGLEDDMAGDYDLTLWYTRENIMQLTISYNWYTLTEGFIT